MVANVAVLPRVAESGEAALVARAQAGDPGAFGEIYERYRARIHNYVHHLMGNAEDAADLSQDTWLKAWRAIGRTSPDLRIGAWLYRIATNVCLDELRHRKPVTWQSLSGMFNVAKDDGGMDDTGVAPGGVPYAGLLTDGGPAPDQQVLDGERCQQVAAVFRRLIPKYRLSLALREYGGLSYLEIAGMMGMSHASVKSVLFRARQAFRREWRALYPGEAW